MFNPVTSLNGAEFLVFYAAVILATIVACRWLARRSDPTASDEVPGFPQDVDLDEVAYVRGGKEELTRAVIARLVVRGDLRIQRIEKEGGFSSSTENMTRLVAAEPSANSFSALDGRVYNWFESPRTKEEVFGPSGLSSIVDGFATTRYEEKLRADGILLPDDVRSKIWRIAIKGAIIIGVLGIARLAVGLSRGRPVGFLVAMGIIGLVALLGICAPHRQSSRGRNYVARVTTMYKAQGASAPLEALVSVGGIGALAGTPYAYLSGWLENSSDRSSGYGGGCGGGGCGGGGCGGCGGCGG